MFEFKHILESQQFNRQNLMDLFNLAKEMETVAKKGSEKLKGKILITLFYEASTRTRISFESAMLKLGGSVISTENAAQFSSAAKGETIEDTIRVLNGYGDVIVIRHYEEGACKRAAMVSDVPIINAGDGTGQHPTQALLDLYTIEKELGRLNNLNVALVGDLANGRTVRSLVYLLSKFDNNKYYFVSPENVRMKDDIKDYLKRHNIYFKETDSLEEAMRWADVVYQTRIQRERFLSIEEYEKCKGIYIIDNHYLNFLKPESIIMHPLPRVDEIKYEVDHDKRAAYFRQAQNGLFIRMALLLALLDK